MQFSGKVCMAAELGEHYGVVDIDGRQPPSPRAIFGGVTEFGDAIVQ
jgi:hypothetical protein